MLHSAIIKNNSDQIEKEMYPNKSSGKKPKIIKYSTQIEQAISIINKIKKSNSSIQETNYLFSSKANAKHIREGIQQANDAKTTKINLKKCLTFSTI